MSRRFAEKVVLGFLLLSLSGSWCYAQSECSNTYDVTGIDDTGKSVTVSFRLRKPNCDYGEAKKNKDTADQIAFMSPRCHLIGYASARENCAGYVLNRLWNIGKYDTAADKILQMAQAFGAESATDRVDPLTRKLKEDLGHVQKGDIVVYGNAIHVAIVVSNVNGVVTIEGKDNEGAYFRYQDGDEGGGAKTRWGERHFWRLDTARITSHKKRSETDECTIPKYAITCPASVAVECIQQVPQPDIQTIEKQLSGSRGVLPAGYEWLSGWMVDVKTKDVDNGGSGRAGDPKRITRTYHATIFCEKERPGGGSGMEACQTAECVQTITVEDKKAPEIPGLHPLSVRCEHDIPAPQPGYSLSASDACSGNAKLVHAGDFPQGGKGCKGSPRIIHRVYQATDASGNSKKYTQEIRIENTSPPRILSGLPELKVAQGQGFPAPSPNSVMADDACTQERVKVAWVEDRVVKQGSGRAGDPLIKSRLYRATDACGNYLDIPQTLRMEGGGGGACSGRSQSLEVPNTKPIKVKTNFSTNPDCTYLIRASGEVSDWSDHSDGVDPVWCYGKWRCGEKGEPWQQLRIDDKGMIELAGHNLPFSSGHTYEIRIRGTGRPLEFYCADAMGSSGDNKGSFHVTVTEGSP